MPTPRRARRRDPRAIRLLPAENHPISPATERPAATRRELRERAQAEAVSAETVPAQAATRVDESAFLATAPQPPLTEARTTGPADDATQIDEFAAAAKLFSFSGETPIQVAAAAMDASSTSSEPSATAVVQAPRRGWARLGGSAFKRATTTSLSVGIIGVVGLLAVGMTTPTQAVAAATSTTTAANIVAPGDVPADEIQAYVAPADVENAAIERSDYTTGSIAASAADLGITQQSAFFTNDPDAAIQWPFAVGVSITYGYGMRSGRLHEGADFVPGAGAHVQAVAAGTVRIATESGGLYGVTVVIDHEVDGELVSSRYAHMQYGSLQVSPGEVVEAGQFLGQTGNTGYSFGAHTHFEILQNGTTAIDPIAWLQANAGRDSLG